MQSITDLNFFKDGKCECWAEVFIRKYLNFGISTTSRVEESHRALTLSTGTLYTAGNKINRRDIDRSEELSIIGSNENILVRLEIRNQIETSGLSTVISRSALELVYTEVAVEGDAAEILWGCSIWHRYRLPCFHQIRHGFLFPVHPVFPPLNIDWQQIDPQTLLTVRDSPVRLPRKGRPIGTRRLPTSAEISQETGDRDGKVRRCGPATKLVIIVADARN
ncbi:hypothetical protein V1520DRAFT_393829 [Lipomyces starkeyi]